MDGVSMANCKVRYYDPSERASEKQRSRDEDARRLASGEVTQEELRRENGIFYGLKVRARIDLCRKLS